MGLFLSHKVSLDFSIFHTSFINQSETFQVRFLFIGTVRHEHEYEHRFVIVYNLQ